MKSKEYEMPDGRKAVFEYDVCGIGKITLECMDELMAMIADRPSGEWIEQEDCWQCSECGDEYVLEVDVKPIDAKMYYCPNCGARMKGADDDKV